MRFLATEYVTGKAHGGRIDTLGLNDNNCPVIIEYMRALNENVISQGLFYLDWLMDHQGEFTLQVLKKLGPEWSDRIDWSGPRLLCIAGDFTRYDEDAVLQIPRNIELLRYRRYGGDLLLLELIRASNTAPNPRRSHAGETVKEKQSPAAAVDPGVETKALRDVWESLKAFLLALGDDVQMKELEQYVAFRRLKNFACVKVRHKDLQIWARIACHCNAGRGIHARCRSGRPFRDLGSGNQNTNNGRSGTRPVAAPAQLPGRLIRTSACPPKSQALERGRIDLLVIGRRVIHVAYPAGPGPKRDTTHVFTLDTENITVHATRKAARETGAGVFDTAENLVELIGPDNRRLVDIWNSLTGVTPVKRFTSRAVAAKRIFAELQKLTLATEAPVDSTEQATAALGVKAAKKNKSVSKAKLVTKPEPESWRQAGNPSRPDLPQRQSLAGRTDGGVQLAEAFGSGIHRDTR